MNSTTKIQRLSYILLLSSITLIFVMSIAMKFTNNEEVANNFSKWDMLEYKNWIAIIECCAVLLYLVPKTNLIGAIGLIGIMLGAIYTHYSFQEPFYFQLAIIFVITLNYVFVKPKKSN